MPARQELPPRARALALSQDQVLSLGQLTELGVTEGHRRHRLLTGEWRQPVRGAYLLQTGEPSTRQRWQLALASTEFRAVLWGPTAAELVGMRGYADRRVHIAIPYHLKSRSSADWLIVHRSRRWNEQDLTMHAGLRRVSTALAVVQAAGLRRRPVDAVALLAAAVQQRVVITDHLIEAVDKHWQLHNKLEMKAALEDVRGGARSLPEREFRKLCRDYGLPQPRMQAPRLFEGRRRYLDADFVDYGVVVEIDGQWHMEITAWMDDLARQNLIAIDGAIVLRFPASLVRFEPAEVARVIQQALVRRGWKPRPS